MSISVGLLMLAAQSSPWIDPAPTGRWAGSTAKLASDLLPPAMAADVLSHEVQRPIVEGGAPYMIRFAGKPRPTGSRFCERNSYNVYIVNKGQVQPGSPHTGVELRLGDCPTDTDAIFAKFNPDDASGAELAFGWIDWARREARSSRPLQFKIICRSETEQDRCADGGRQAVANLQLDKTFMLRRKAEAPAHQWEFWVTETRPGQELWDVAVDATPGKSTIDLTWKIPSPF